MKKKRFIWTNEDIDLLRKVYPKSTHQEVSKYFPRASRTTIRKKAKAFGIKKDLSITYSYFRKCDLSNLLNDDAITYYLIGLLLSDGCFTKTGSVSIAVQYPDKDWLYKAFYKLGKTAFYTSYHTCTNEKKIKMFSFQGNHQEIYYKLKDKFDFRLRKTYNPPRNLSFYNSLSDDLFLSIVAGMIDGDGCIHRNKKSGCLSVGIVSHKSWEDFFNMVRLKLSRILKRGLPSLKFSIKDNCVKLYILDFPSIRELKKRLIELNLPLLERKWSKIDLNHVTYHEVTSAQRETLNDLLKTGLDFKIACKNLSLSAWKVKKFSKERLAVCA